MRWVRLLRLQLNRAVTGRMIPAASGIAFLHALSAVGFMQEACCPRQIEDRSIVIDGDSGEVIKQLL